MKSGLLSVGIAALLICSHAFAQAPNGARPPRLLNPKNIGEQSHQIIVDADKRRDGSYRFTVNIRAKDLKFPLEEASSYLRIQDGDKLVCGCPLKAESDKSSVWFEFDVAASYTAKSQFSLLIYTATAEERKKLSSASGWISYEFTLRDFVVEDKSSAKTQSK